MLCVVIHGPTFEEAHQQLAKAVACADLAELRLDCFEHLELADLRNLRSHFSIPMIFTLRNASQGGNYPHAEEKRLADMRLLATLGPEYLDLEKDVAPHFIEEISFQHPGIKLILSYHHFSETPEDLEGLYREMQQIPAFYYKLAVTPQSSLDVIRLLCWKQKSDAKLIAISMGPLGQIGRIIGPVLGCPITYASLDPDRTIAPGQLSVGTLLDQYHFRSLNAETGLYGLIGDPVDQSISEVTHNHLMTVGDLHAVYVKIQVKPSELAQFLHFARQLPFRGLSVTMPLKEYVLAHLDAIDPHANAIGAVNTLLFEEGKIYGFNTDGVGALNAIEHECSVKNKHLVLIGAGGSAKAIAHEALRRGAHVTIVNRDVTRANELAVRLQCNGKGLESMAECIKEGYDVLINCTPSPLPISPDFIIPQTVVMDIKTKPKDTPFLQHAVEKKCRIIYGYQMFVEQAIGQFHLWFKDRVDAQTCRTSLQNKSLECLSKQFNHLP